MNYSPVENNEQLEQILFEFEQAWFEDPETNLENFLPPATSSNYIEVLAELIRSEMEFLFDAGQPCEATGYFDRYPILNRFIDWKKAVIFEEYRLRNGRGDSVTAETLGRKYGIDSQGWPDLVGTGSDLPSTEISTTPGRAARKKISFPKVGATIEDFELVGQLGEGAFGRVFLAQQGDLERRLVVLKLTSVQTDEHRLLARLQHTNIVPIHSVHRFGDLQAICMPLLGVATLDDILRYCGKTGPQRISQESNALVQTVNKQRERTVAETIPDEEKATHFRTRQRLPDELSRFQRDPSMHQFAARFVGQMAEGLGYAHQRGIVHGDLKPANLLVDDDGNAVILDFHLGFCADDSIGRHFGGTLPYMAPEHLQSMALGKTELEPTMDVYSAGIILYELLTGELPYHDELGSTFSPEQLADAKNKRFFVPRQQRSLIGNDLAAIVETCLDPDPAKRFANGSELAHELQRAIGFQPLRKAANGSLPNRIRKWAKRHPRLTSASTVAAISAVVIAAAGIAFWMVSSELNRINSIARSRTQIETAREIQPSLATSIGLHDRSFFRHSIEKGESYLRQNSWESRAALESQPHFAVLSVENAEQERLAAAELHFWLAEVNRKLAVLTGDENRFQTALKHNRCADSFWPEYQSKTAIVHQQYLIGHRSTSAETSTDKLDASAAPDNRIDRMLAISLRDRDPELRESIYRQLAVEDSNDFLSWMLLGNSCAAQNKFEQAEAFYTVCSSIEHDSNLPALYRGIARMEQGKIGEALEDFAQADHRTPDDITTLLNYALALGKSGKLREALAKYDRAIELGASQSRAWYLRSRLKQALKKDAAAKLDFEIFMEMQPTDSKSAITRGNQKIKDAPQEAINDYRLAIHLNPRSADAWNNIAHVYSEKLGDTRKAIDAIGRAVELAPDNAVIVASRGVLYARVGDADAAIIDAENALGLSSSPEITYRVAGIYAQLSRENPDYAKKATSLLSKAAFLSPSLVLKMSRTDPDIVPLREHADFNAVFDAIGILKSAGNAEK